MICKECKDSGLKSVVYPGASYVTCAYYQPFYDEEGNYHNHDANSVTTNYSCSNGHSWVEHGAAGSCQCGWPNKKEAE